jgi:hypothetical protein
MFIKADKRATAVVAYLVIGFCAIAGAFIAGQYLGSFLGQIICLTVLAIMGLWILIVEELASKRDCDVAQPKHD